ncbi:hypothetical protein EIN_341160 [Entamoeba invadens IP1]|uniref:Uncharacterized protein n=1 Tax=Entamoeba invadens IP1 TaxID=370355 RepID=A0A0A1UGB9_ENTIV|nr:hypothetical protein EIN_341160 [Entamoeba invadens IP1]ELP94748.1 hypothetical protein EIN_341160 [Entamoeba invadens IP1]|eukprot:XP_004261519.1 hypothetical protein EIN_341160 [Entamoeba invadens IP1]
MSCYCPPVNGAEAISFFQDYTHNCFYDGVDVFSYICGLINIMFWMFAQFPQIYQTFKSKKPESLSITFLVMWLGGDLTNLIGCIFTNQTQVQLLTSIYFVLIDIVMLSQYAWYLLICRKKYSKDKYLNLSDPPSPTRFNSNSNSSSNTMKKDDEIDGFDQNNKNSPEIQIENVETQNDTYANNTNFLIVVLIVTVSVFGQDILSENNSTNSSNNLPICGVKDSGLTERIIGDVSAWVSGLLYFFGRFPQAVHIYRKKDVEGLSILLFLMSTIANVFYSISIFTSGIDLGDPTFYEAQAAYVVGSCFVIPLSVVIISQIIYYRYVKNWIKQRKRENKMEKIESKPLLGDCDYIYSLLEYKLFFGETVLICIKLKPLILN